METKELIKRLLDIQQKIEHDNYTWENIQTLIKELNKEL